MNSEDRGTEMKMSLEGVAEDRKQPGSAARRVARSPKASRVAVARSAIRAGARGSVAPPLRTVLLFLLLGTTHCHWFVPLEIEAVSFCDLYEDDGCVEPWNGNRRTYTPEIPEYKQDSWYDLGYHMYFHTRETPGVRVKFNRGLSAGEIAGLEKNLHCEYELQRDGRTVSGHLEGTRVDADGIWCFDYLGTMLVNWHKQNGSDKERPSAEFFPVQLRLHFKSDDPAVTGSIEGAVVVDFR